MKLNKTYLRQIVFWVIIVLLANFVQADYYSKNINYIEALRFKAYFGVYLLMVIWILREIVLSLFFKRGAIYPLIRSYKSVGIPFLGKILFVIVFLGNFTCIFIGKPIYPFYDVGMFRWSSKFEDKSKIVYKPKYYYWKNGEAEILDLRKEGYYFLHNHIGLRYTHEFTFAATYHNKGQKENFDFIMQKMRERGIDTLWVGVHAVNYETKEVWFDYDKCNAIKVNMEEPIHYGPIYIPTYQIKKCNEN